MEQYFFPYKEFRRSQEAFVTEVYNCVKEGKSLIVHAPTGSGKSVSTLAPALKHAIDKDINILFLTSRHTQHKIVIDTLREIKQKYKLNFLVSDIVGKKHMCSQQGAELANGRDFTDWCNKLVEDNKCNYYLNSKSKEKKVEREFLLKKLEENNPLDVASFCEESKENNFCGFELSVDVGKKAKVIIADYFHVLNPSIREAILSKMNKKIGNSIIVFDEAHNLPDRCRDLMSENLTNNMIEMAFKEAKDKDELATKILELGYKLEELGREKIIIDQYEALVKKDEFFDKVNEIQDYWKLIAELDLFADKIREKEKRSFVGSLARFLEKWVEQDDGFVRIIKKGHFKSGKNYIALSYRCLDPSIVLRPILSEAYCCIFMSGTLTPTDMYADIFGIKDIIKREYKDPFPRDNRLNLIVTGVTTKFTKRDNKMYEDIAKKCSNIVDKIPGNVILFFPSYNFRDDVDFYFRNITTKKIFYEINGANKGEREGILDDFKKAKVQGAVLLAISNGSYGEGIDLPGDLLNGVVVVGLPLAKPDLETKELINYYDKKYGKGWDYGYVMPAFIKSLQNAGRCIRSETDKGVIVFLEERYLWERYFKIFPKDLNLKVTLTPEIEIEKFFNNQ